MPVNPADVAALLDEQKRERARRLEKMRANSRRYYLAHKTELYVKSRKWNAEHPKVIRAAYRKYRVAHREKCSEYNSRYYREHKAGRAEYARQWRAKNHDHVIEYGRSQYAANPDRARQYSSNRRTRKRNCGGRFTAAEWKSLCDKYDNRCLRCGDKKKLTVDHVVPLINGGWGSIDNIQPLCVSCNSSKQTKHVDYRTQDRGRP